MAKTKGVREKRRSSPNSSFRKTKKIGISSIRKSAKSGKPGIAGHAKSRNGSGYESGWKAGFMKGYEDGFNSVYAAEGE